MTTRNELDGLLRERGVLDLPAVEVGVAEGHYSHYILGWGIPKLHLVELWAHVPGGYAELDFWSDKVHERNMQNTIELLKPYEGKYEILRGWSYEMCDRIEDESLGFAFIDASHDYENALRDLYCYWPKLVDDGVMAGHDWPIAGVRQAVEEFAEKEDLEIHLLPTGDPNDISYWLEKR